MPMLGDLLAAARESSGRFEAWLTHADPGLAGNLREAARGEGLSPTGFVRAAVADFSRLASEEDWATLISGIRDSADPGTTCLLAMVDWRLTAPRCGDHARQAGPTAGRIPQ
ncbi:hypothetical protein GON01_07820 [Sphingomonas sp. MAH-20]|jgi:hypothetical protein|uniref:Uncharacterized protein n=1 Tax=Sphingomonas horti TaxID=2682842 RepID=A0A6I4IZY1_9SPHN|nr:MULTISPECIES: hypothetical protein [Sphingomonas]MBA2919958.1 hypothetical protein [Sphingomonas sp. CGMCC 1.13658]MVO77840.1 hypothetical protein [Sphingomonas horti]